MRPMRKPRRALLGVLFVGVVVAAGASPAWAAPPYPTGNTATALVGGTPLIRAVCTVVGPQLASGSSTRGIVTVTGAGAQCTGNSASTNGQYAISGVTTGTLRFNAQCINSTGTTNGSVDVPAGTNIAGFGVTPTQRTVTNSTTVTYPGGTTAILNQVVTTPTSVTRTAIQITSGPAAGTVIGRVTCGTPVYPLAVDAPGAGEEAPEVALASASPDRESGSSDNRVLLVGGAIALLVLTQVAVGRSMLRRRRGDATI
jgi:hypothetical protein